MAHCVGRILCVDDDAQITALLTAMLELAGYEVTVDTSSVAALDIFRRDPQRFDLVITDYAMPEMAGDVLIGHLRRLRPDIPIILCSGFYRGLDEERMQSIGADAFFTEALDQ